MLRKTQLPQSPRVIGFPTSAELTQGTLFSGVSEAAYLGCTVFGLLLTARCDIANAKVGTFNFLPVVSLEDWLEREGRQILSIKAITDINGLLRNTLDAAGFTPSILDTKSPEEVLEQVLGPEETSKRVRSNRSRFIDLLQTLRDIENIQKADAEDVHRQELLQKAGKYYPKFLEELVKNKLAGYYYLDEVTPGDPSAGYVALLREVRSMPTQVAIALARGVTAEDLATLRKTVGGADILEINSGNEAIPVGVLQSPNIEHLMQTFANLFTRIGVEDFPGGYASALLETATALETENS